MKTFRLFMQRVAFLLPVCHLLFMGIACAQTDTVKKVPIEIVKAGMLQVIETDTGAVNKLLDDVVLKQEDSYMYCDSAYLNLKSNNLEAFGNVHIVQPGSQGYSDYLRYTGNNRHAYMRGNVNLTDNKDNLWSEEVDYDMVTKIGTYANHGTLQSGTTTVSSNSGIYNMRSKEAQFQGNVIVTDPEYHIVSEDLGYNSETKVMTFFSPAVVTSDSSVLKTSCGTYDTKNEIAYFPCRASIVNKEQYLEADTIDYNKQTGAGIAIGKVIAIDTAQRTTLYSGRTDYNDKKNTMLATIKPVLKQMNGDDSLFIRADTLFSARVPRAGDTIKIKRTVMKTVLKGKKEVVVPVVIEEDSIAVDSNRPRYFIGYHHVIIFSDSMQGRGDSISYSQVDSVMRLMYDPIVWSRESQITGDTILLYMDSGKLNKMYVPNNALVVSQSGPPKAGLFDQVQGKTLTGYFIENAIRETWVMPDAETIYYSKDERDAYLGVNKASSVRMYVLFKNQKIDNIRFYEDVKQEMTPLDKADLPAMKLSRYKWQPERRPKSLKELFE